MAWPPQAPHTAAWNSRGPPTVRARFAAARHDGQRCGSLTKPLLAKKVCSPAEKMNSSEQSRQVNVRSWYTLVPPWRGRRDGARADQNGRAVDRDADSGGDASRPVRR